MCRRSSQILDAFDIERAGLARNSEGRDNNLTLVVLLGRG
jgi:hypothetical protein